MKKGENELRKLEKSKKIAKFGRNNQKTKKNVKQDKKMGQKSFKI